MEYTPDNIKSLEANGVFVFGSNLAGAHGGGAARVARERFGAVWGQGVGLQGQSYAIPTMQGGVETIKPYVDQFIAFAEAHPELKFYVTRIGCGIAGFTVAEIAPLFLEASGKPNIVLPRDFLEAMDSSHPEQVSTEVTWNSRRDFLDEYQVLKAALRCDPGAYGRIKELRCKEYRNTIDIVNQGWYVTENGDKVVLGDDESMRRDSRFYSTEIRIREDAPGTEYTEIDVVNRDCLAEAVDLLSEGFNPAVLNMASRRNPGGGVISGAGAQEETLFRRTNLFRSLYQFAPYAGIYGVPVSSHQYPLDHNFGGVYTPGATLFRQDEEHGYRLMDKPVRLSFISVAGMNRPQLVDGDTMIAPHLVEPVKNKIRTILAIGLIHGHDSLVLGALGCGAFRNPPRHVAQLFRQVLDESVFRNRFSRITFAIIDDHNAHHAHNPQGNYLPFKQVFP